LFAGDDGLRFERPLRKSGWVPIGAIERLEASTFWMRPAISLVLRGGERFEIVWGRGTREQATARDELVRRLTEAIAQRDAVVDESSARNRSTVREGLERVRALHAPAGYRGASTEMLLALVANPAAAPTARVGAAAALGSKMADDERAHIRVAARDCAEPRLRV